MLRLSALVLGVIWSRPTGGDLGTVHFTGRIESAVTVSAGVVSLGADDWLEIYTPERATAYLPAGVHDVVVRVEGDHIEAVTSRGGELVWYTPPRYVVAQRDLDGGSAR